MKKVLTAMTALAALAALAVPALAQAPNVIGHYIIGSGRSSVSSAQWPMEIHISSQNLAGRIGGTVVLFGRATPGNPSGRIKYACSGTVTNAGDVTLSFGRFPYWTTLRGVYWERFRPVYVRFISGSYETWYYGRIPGRRSDWGTFGVSGW